MVLNAYQELLNKTYSLVDEAQIARITKYLNEAERVFVCGKGSSGLTASEMEIRFMRIGVDIDSLQDSDLIRMQAVFQDKKSMVFGISISGEKEEVLYLLREAKKRGARTVLITAKNKDIFGEFCSEVVLLPSLKHLNHGNLISPWFKSTGDARILSIPITWSRISIRKRSFMTIHCGHSRRAGQSTGICLNR